MNPDEYHHQSSLQSSPLSPGTLTLETPTPQTIDSPDHGPQKPRIFLENTRVDEDADPPLATSKSPPITPRDAAAAISRRGHKGKKLGTKWMDKKYQQKFEALLRTFKPVPFTPAKALDFARHEELLKRLGLWEFVHVSFDRTLRSDLIVQLVTRFKKKERCSYVNGVRILVNRADLARALKLPFRKKERGSSGLEISGEKPENAECIGFLLDFVSNWVLLHDDMWIMPDNVLSWLTAIREGRFESLDWPEMMWFMVEKELIQGAALKNCYYASHLQCLIKYQRDELLREAVDVKDEDEDVKIVDLEEQSLELSLGHETVNSVDVDETEVAGGAEVGVQKDESFIAEKRDKKDESSVGQDEGRIGIEEEGIAEDDVREEADEVEHQVEEVKEQGEFADVMDSEDKEEEEQRQLYEDGQTETGECFLQPCSFNNVGDIDMDYRMDKVEEEEEVEEQEVEEQVDDDEEDEEDEEEEEEREGEGQEGEEGQEMEEHDIEEEVDADDDEEEQEDEQQGFHISENINGLEGLSSPNLMQFMENGQMPFSLGVQIHDDSYGEILTSSSRADTHLGPSGPSIYENPSKRAMDDNCALLLDSGPNKRMRTEQLDFNTCRENVLSWIEKMRVAHEAREQIWGTSAMNQQMLLNELNQRDSMIEHLQKARLESQQKMQQEIYRLERELHMMVRLLEGYRKALKESNRAFADYRARCPQLDEPLYRDVPGSGGLVLSVTELEKQRIKREEDERMKLLIIKDSIKDFEAMWSQRFEAHLEGVQLLANKLLKIEEKMKAMKELAEKRKVGKETADEIATEVKAKESANDEMANESADQEMAKEYADDEMANESADDEMAKESADDEMAKESADEEMAKESTDQEMAKESTDQEMAEDSAQVETGG